jgi:putative endonuclease
VTATRQSLGRHGEEIAVSHLRELGYTIVQRNARTRHGELDVVALEGTTLVFVEVKTGRIGTAAGPERPALAVGARKRARIRRLARAWLAKSGRPRYEAVRLDVIGITLASGGRVVALEHIENAL